MKSVTSYPFALNAGQSISLPIEGEYFRVQSALGAIDITVDGAGTLPDLQAGQGIKNTPFKRLTIKDKSGAANAGVILVAFEEFIDNRTYGINDLSAGSLNTLRQPLAQTGFFSDASALTANTPIQVIAPGSNINGAIILTADIASWDANTGIETFVSKASAPANIVDGSVVLMAKVSAIVSGAFQGTQGTLSKEQFIAPGQGLYFISSVSKSVGAASYRACRFRLL